MKTLVLLADGAEEIEAITIIDVLRRADIDVYGVSIGDLKRYKGAHGIWSSADMLMEDIDLDDLSDIEAIIIPGGTEGTENLAADKRVISLIQKANEEDKIIGAICAGPNVLEVAAILEGVKFTSYPGLESSISGDFQNDNVVKDGNIVTSRGPATAMLFALELVGLLKGNEKKEEVGQGLLIDHI